MQRMQLYITPEIDRALKTTAKQKGKRMAQIAREILAKGLKVKQKPESPGMFLLDLAAMGFKGPGDLSTNLTSYLYGEKSPNYGRHKKNTHRR